MNQIINDSDYKLSEFEHRNRSDLNLTTNIGFRLKGRFWFYVIFDLILKNLKQFEKGPNFFYFTWKRSIFDAYNQTFWWISTILMDYVIFNWFWRILTNIFFRNLTCLNYKKINFYSTRLIQPDFNFWLLQAIHKMTFTPTNPSTHPSIHPVS